MPSPNTCVWFELPVSDLDRSIRFYGAVLRRELRRDDTGPNPLAAFTDMGDAGVSGHLYPGTPAARGNGPTVHLAVPDGLDAASERVRAEGGEVVSPPIEIPAGRFVYATDPDGNSIGLFETA